MFRLDKRTIGETMKKIVGGRQDSFLNWKVFKTSETEIKGPTVNGLTNMTCDDSMPESVGAVHDRDLSTSRRVSMWVIERMMGTVWAAHKACLSDWQSGQSESCQNAFELRAYKKPYSLVR